MALSREHRCILFDWGNTLMREFSEFSGIMASWPRVEAIPHAQEVLAQLHPDWLLALATNAVLSEEADIWAALGRAGLDQLLDKVYCYRTIGHKKPSPEFFAHILSDLKLDKSCVVMVGDSFESDVLGANRSGIRAVWFNASSDVMSVGEMCQTIHDLRSLPQTLEIFGIVSEA
jgi:putative hydrolase of the HAD superfamily